MKDLHKGQFEVNHEDMPISEIFNLPEKSPSPAKSWGKIHKAVDNIHAKQVEPIETKDIVLNTVSDKVNEEMDGAEDE